MIEETAGAETPAADEVELAATDESTDSSTEQQSEAESDGEAARSDETGEDAKALDGVQQRINEITRKRREAERRAEKLEKKLQEIEARNTDDLDYEDQIAERTLNRGRKDQIEADREAAKELAFEAYQARVQFSAGKYPDYEAVAHSNAWSPTPTMLEVILDSDHGPDIAYHLGKNLSEAHRIASLTPARQAAELGKLEALVTAPKPARKQPPAPINPVGGQSGSGQKDPNKMSMAEYVKWRDENP